MAVSARYLAGLIAHFTVCALYIPVHNFGVDIYISMFGGLTSRGVGIGMVNEAMFYFFVLINGVIFCLPSMKCKLAVVVLMGALIVVYFMPRYPVRAMAYSLLGVFFTLVAMDIRMHLERWLLRVKH